VTKGYEKKLEVVGVGFKVATAPGKLNLSLGFSHPVIVDIPKDLTVTVDKNTISISGADKQKVGQFAAEVRELKKPEPYKGKGIKYSDEVVLRKAGKVVKVVGGGK
jgi:large subunit ribosomal protein L6